MGNGMGIDHQFVNPSEDEFQQSVKLTSALVHVDTDYDTIEAFQNNIEIVDLV
jgi:hypothetical protein